MGLTYSLSLGMRNFIGGLVNTRQSQKFYRTTRVNASDYLCETFVPPRP